MEISLKEYDERAKKLYGEKTTDFKFRCPICGRTQSAQSIKEQMERKEPSKRYGIIDVHKQYIYPESECYSPTCDWTAYGFFKSNIVVIIDPSNPHNVTGEHKDADVTVFEYANNPQNNCAHVFPLADDKEMLTAAGIS